MAGNWMDDRERQMRERDGRAAEPYGGREDRSFDRPDMDAARRGGPERDRVFGERERGADYSGPPGPSGGYRGRAYEGPAPRLGSQDYTRGGRFYDDDSRERIYREQFGYGSGDRDSGQSPTRAAYHGRDFGNPGFDDYGHDSHGRPLSGGTGGYDYERGYGDGGRPGARAEPFEDVGRKSGEFLHRAGQKVASWFAAAGDGFQPGPGFHAEDRGHRGRGPKTYKRSDERIAEDANERLTEDHWLDAGDITVSVSGGEVTLSGAVEDREAKHRAERIVEHLSGVTHVQNNLRIAYVRPAGLNDEAAEARPCNDAPAAAGGMGSGSAGPIGRGREATRKN